MTRSRVSNGIRCTTLVAATCSSAGSLTNSRQVDASATPRSIGHMCTRLSTWANSRSVRSISTQPSCTCLANSYRTMADTDHLLCVNKIRSDSRSSPLTARTRMCVSRLSICLPPDAGGKDVASNPDLVPHTTNQLGVFLIVGKNPGNWLSVFCHDQSVDIQLIQQCQALFFEFRCSNRFHIIGSKGSGLNGTKLSRFSSIFSAKIEEKDCTRADFMEAFEYENITTFPTRF